MKHIILSVTILFFSLLEIYSQNLSKMTVKRFREDNIPVNVCNDGNLGIIVFYSAIKTLNFEAIYPQNAIVDSRFLK